MAKITIEVPDNEDDIPGAIKALKAQLAPISAQRDALLAAIRSVQARCPHKTRTAAETSPAGRTDTAMTVGTHGERLRDEAAERDLLELLDATAKLG